MGARLRRVRFSGIRGGVAAAVVLACVALLAAYLEPADPMLTGRALASDGDSLRIGGERIRLVGIDAPELDQVCWTQGGDTWPCGITARERLATLLNQAELNCSTQGRDRYGRLLARCRDGDKDLAATMVGDGFAVADVDYKREEIAARAARRGIWSGRFDDPATWRREGPSEVPGGDIWAWLVGWFAS